MDISYNNEVWAIIPARGGSKSIPLKNMAELCGQPLIKYVIEAGKKSEHINRMICSTDHDRIASFCKGEGVEVMPRPDILCGDSVAVSDVIIDLLKTIAGNEGALADIVVLLEPTYPFILPEHIDDCVSLLKADPEADSVQSVTEVQHNNHAYNQRSINEGKVDFVFKKERLKCFNKQLKPKYFIHGNLFVFRARTIIETGNIYGEKSLPYQVPRIYSFDVDGPQDLEIAQCLLKYGLISKAGSFF
ncbi:MAG: acylneuraminate cytidylyltransferase family protein [Candidatus Omnitrophica bacterium]|nr:acylneuraminate cytidylyltransferase family protein [Candidatus Omnitrophota bacterium]